MEICGLKIFKWAPMINHIHFANPSLLFYEATVEENGWVQHLLNKYAVVFGQLLNVDKTTLFFSSNVPHETQQEIRRQ